MERQENDGRWGENILLAYIISWVENKNYHY